MNITIIFPLLVGLLELGASIFYAWNGQWWIALTWFAYAVGCVGLVMGSLK